MVNPNHFYNSSFEASSTDDLLLSTTSTLQDIKIDKYLGLVSGETIIGTSYFRDFSASVTDFFGGRSSEYENVLIRAKESAMYEMKKEAIKLGANAIIAIDIDYETVSTMMVVCVMGTAVKISK